MCQKGRLHLYPVQWDELMANIMVDCYAEFWTLVKEDGEYPPIAEDDKPEYQDISKHLEKSNKDLALLCGDYLKWAAAERAAKTEKDKLKEDITFVLIALMLSTPRYPAFKSKLHHKPKKRKHRSALVSFMTQCLFQ